ncbi:uncharacterized protein MELLADRAFT_63998 [Melampsora larici-populina 98AG31]|uniref:Uncharacterized protein n=1 Tax=Melampsora larici-populina (strain 98AG31 / pathotype 3-4-7) TaxID=747676 RepID=F4RPS6_MELLP|nr:uncharacterized protein MELLADRAFT_63998 [Melampsora larici-populina 98AG31]EGG05598.1 hypothetical protein MELLADRAFT_63998 [Melampsora larici-populina 98AG31]
MALLKKYQTSSSTSGIISSDTSIQVNSGLSLKLVNSYLKIKAQKLNLKNKKPDTKDLNFFDLDLHFDLHLHLDFDLQSKLSNFDLHFHIHLDFDFNLHFDFDLQSDFDLHLEFNLHLDLDLHKSKIRNITKQNTTIKTKTLSLGMKD